MSAGARSFVGDLRFVAVLAPGGFERLALGDLIEYDVRATIVPDMQAIDVLLGMSFLRRLDFAQRGDELWLEQRRRGERAL